jgi:hypothetical protein
MEPVDLRNGDPSQPLSLAFCGRICESGTLAVLLTPDRDLNEVGQDHEVIAVVECGDEPKPAVTVSFTVDAGPNTGSTGSCTPNPDCTTDAGGTVSFTYAGDGGSGADRITASFVLDEDGETITSDPAFKFWDEDCNKNDVADTCDLSCVGFDGSCTGYPGCGASSDVNQNGVPDECNTDPVCTNASADPGSLWPPNHVLVPIEISGVTDAENDPVTITATGVTQDEKVRTPGAGSGNTSPDAALSPLAVRAERNGNPKTPGNGRVYHISFTADDGQGGSCNGAVNVCVPHDRRPGATCVDGDPLYNSIP